METEATANPTVSTEYRTAVCRSLSKAARASSVASRPCDDEAVSASMRRAARARRAAARPHKAAAIAQNTAAAASHGWVNMPQTLLDPRPNSARHA